VNSLGNLSPTPSAISATSNTYQFADTTAPSPSHPSPDERVRQIEPQQTHVPEDSPAQTVNSASFKDSVQGVVTTEVGRFPKNSKFTGMTSPQVFAKSAEEIFKSVAPNINVMEFFCPNMKFSEELPLWSSDQHPLIEKGLADGCLQREQIPISLPSLTYYYFVIEIWKLISKIKSGYFSTYHPLFPAFDARAFHDDYEAFYRSGRSSEPATAVCIYLTIALGSDDYEVSDLHFRAVCRLHGDLVARPYFISVQAFILMV
jgi:hypothetical protein